MRHRIGIVITIILIILSLYLLDIKCIFKLLYGISCPGCGLTRAYKSLINLDIASAMYFHPLFWTIPIIVFLYIKDRNSKYLIFFIILFLAAYIIRLFDNKCDIVTINLKESLFYNIIKSIIE